MIVAAFFGRHMYINSKDGMPYNFALSGEGQLATVALANLLYTIPALLGHMQGDTYGIFVRHQTFLHLRKTCKFTNFIHRALL